MAKYNLNALRERKVTSTITAFLNGRASEEEVIKQLDKVFIPEDEFEEDPVLDEVEEISDIHSEYQKAISGKKDDLISFADKYGIDLSGASNNSDRIQIIKDWYELQSPLNNEEE